MANGYGADAILDKLVSASFRFLCKCEQLNWIKAAGTLHRNGMSAFRIGEKPMNIEQIEEFILADKPNSATPTEPSFETQIENLISVGLLCRDKDGAIICPVLETSRTRADASRTNGLRGGRPKKMSGQTNVVRLDTSPRGDNSKTQPEKTENPSKNRTIYLLKDSNSKVKVSSSATTEFDEIGREAFEASGINPAISRPTWTIVQQWLADGADREMILDVIRTKTKSSVTTLNYFTAAIKERIAARPKPKPEWEKAYDLAMSNWELFGRGFEPMPHIRDFKPAVAI
jgi:hypothetical protein